MHVIGTAGHVDHGKSALVRALTGIDPDRLREEQERQMTIDLGFAWLTLPGGDEVGIVDVPGHRDFIENMLAGVGAIDAAVLVVAADEGVMPQTAEHVAILDLLEISRGIVALTKTDLIDDPSWLDLVREDIRRVLSDTPLSAAPIVPVSSITGEGIEKLISSLEAVLKDTPARRDIGRPRLSIDRAFTISGFGTIVTGTLVDGALEVGDEVEILPHGLKGRIRGLQTHKTKVDRADPGRRLAINLTGVEVGQLQRGDVVAHSSTYSPTRLLDVQFRLLEGSDSPLKHDQMVKVFTGAAQCMARIRILGRDSITPGESGWLQLVLDSPLTAERHDRFILRRPSPPATLGGGQVADAHPRRLYRRMDRHVLERLQALTRGTSGDVLLQALVAGPTPLRIAVRQANLEEQSAQDAIRELVDEGKMIALTNGDLTPDAEVPVLGAGSWAGLTGEMRSAIGNYHAAFPLRTGIPREELKSRLALDQKSFAAVMARAAADGLVRDRGPRVALPDFEVKLSEAQREKVASLMRAFESDPSSPPSVKQALSVAGNDLFGHLIETGALVQVSTDVVFEANAYRSMVTRVKARLGSGGPLTVAEVRDMFRTSRKYALALMEHLDAIGVTIRQGDERRLA